MAIDYDNLCKCDWSKADAWLCKRAEEILLWALEHLKKGTFARNYYEELLELVIVWLGWHVENFSFKYPGADHHARWMSKALYFMKLLLLLFHVDIILEEVVEEENEGDENQDNTKKKKRRKKKKVAGDGMVLTVTEKLQVMKVREFVGLFYAQAFFKSPLSASAPMNDHVFMKQMRRIGSFCQRFQMCFRSPLTAIS